MVTASSVLKVARSQLGTVESPAGSNRVKYNQLVSGWQGEAWCAAFVSWCFAQLGAVALLGGPENYTVAMSKWFRAHGQWSSTPHVGDVVFFNFGAPNGYREHDDLGIHHVGIVESLLPDGRIQTIEGNTSTSSDDNGGAVMRRQRSRSGVAGYGRPAYDKEATVPDSPSFVTVLAKNNAQVHELVALAAKQGDPYAITHVPVSDRWPAIMPALKVHMANLVRELVKAVKP